MRSSGRASTSCARRPAPTPSSSRCSTATANASSPSRRPRGPFAQCRPEVLKGEALEALPWIRSRLEHVRILEIRDTVSARAEQEADAGRLAGLDIRSLLLIAFAVQGTVRGFLAFVSSTPRDGWDVNLHLLLKLVGTSLACGLEKVALADRLADMQEREEMALPCANDGMWDYDTQGNRTYFSPRWKNMLGYAEDDVSTSPDWHRSCIRRTSRRCRPRSAITSTARRRCSRACTACGTRTASGAGCISRANALVDDKGRLQRLVGVELDITERKLYEEALFREKESAQITLQSIGDGVITTDAHCLVEYLNPMAEELTGWRLEDSQGRPIDDIFRGLPRGDLRAARESARGRHPPQRARSSRCVRRCSSAATATSSTSRARRRRSATAAAR